MVFIIKQWPYEMPMMFFYCLKKRVQKMRCNHLDKLSHPLNCFLAACYEVFDRVDSLEYNKTKKTASYLSVFNNQFTNNKKTKKRHKLVKSLSSFKI